MLWWTFGVKRLALTCMFPRNSIFVFERKFLHFSFENQRRSFHSGINQWLSLVALAASLCISIYWTWICDVAMMLFIEATRRKLCSDMQRMCPSYASLYIQMRRISKKMMMFEIIKIYRRLNEKIDADRHVSFSDSRFHLSRSAPNAEFMHFTGIVCKYLWLDAAKHQQQRWNVSRSSSVIIFA